MPQLPLTNAPALDLKALDRLISGTQLVLDTADSDEIAYANGVRDVLYWLRGAHSSLRLWALLDEAERRMRERHYGVLASEAAVIDRARRDLGLEGE